MREGFPGKEILIRKWKARTRSLNNQQVSRPGGPAFVSRYSEAVRHLL